MYIVSFCMLCGDPYVQVAETKMSHKITMVHKPSKRKRFSSPISNPTLKGHVQCIYTTLGHCSLRGNRY